MAFEGGDGSAGNPYQISTPQQLQAIQNDLSANYVLINDIDCSGFDFSSIGDNNNPFTGVLNGQGYIVNNLTINEENTDYVGLIGYLNNSAEVKNIGVVNANITGDSEVGILVGTKFNSSVSSSFSTGSVSNSGTYAGGLVGLNGGGSVSNSYSTASVNGESYLGGLVGGNQGTVSESYSTGSVSGSGAGLGYFIGRANGSVSNCYYNIESNDDVFYGSEDATGLTTSEMQGSTAETNMSGFDFSNTWATTNSYPILLSQLFPKGDGSSSNPYQISTPQQLQAIQNDLSANYVLINDIDCSGFSYSSIGVYPDDGFTGVLDGQGYVVENLTINEGSSDYVGLMGYLGSSGEVKNIGVVNADISGEYYVGGLIGYSYDNTSVSNSFSTGSVSGYFNVGGLIGEHRGTVSKSYSTASVSGTNYVGGLIGDTSGNTSNGFSTGSVSGTDYVGGLIGSRAGGGIPTGYWDTESSGQSSGIGSGSGDITGLTTSEMQGSTPFCAGTMTDSPAFDFTDDWVTIENDYPELRTFSQSTENVSCISPDFSISDSSPKTGETVTFDASSTTVEGRTVSSYEWDLNEDDTYEATGVTTDKTYSTTGIKTATLLVTDSSSDTNSISKDLNVVTDDFLVTITGGDSFVFEDDVLDIEYSVENVGGGFGTQDIELTTTVQGSSTVVDSDTVSLDPGQTKTGTLSYDLTGEPVEPEETATVSTEDSSASGLFFVAQYRFLETIAELEDGQEYEFRAAAQDDFGIDTGQVKTVETVKRTLGSVTTDSITSGDIDQTELNVSGTVDSIGDYGEVGFDVFFEYRETGASTWQSTSRQSASSTGSFSETISGLTEETDYEVRIVGDFGGDEVDGGTVTAATLAPVFDIVIDSINSFLKEGRTLTIDYTATNTGTVQSTQDITLAFDTDANVVDTNTGVTIGSGSTSSGTLTFDTTGQSEAVYDIFLSGAEGETASTVEILDGSLIEFLSPDPGEVVATRSPTLEYRVDIEGTGTVEVLLDGNTLDSVSAPFDNQVLTASASDLDRDNQSRTWRITYTGNSPDRDVTESFIIGFNLKEVDPEVI